MSKLSELLEYLETHLDEEHLEHSLELHKKALTCQTVPRLPLRSNFPLEEANLPLDITPYPYEETYEDMEKMMFNELLPALMCTELQDDSFPMIRANYGVATMPSLFGAKSQIVNGNMPWVDHFENEEEIQRIVDKGVPDSSFLWQRTLDTQEYYNEVLSKYPLCRKHVHIFHPDLQGPFDISHLLWGSDIYMAIYDNPQLVKELMEVVTQTYIKCMKQIKKTTTDDVDGGAFAYHWGMLYSGGYVLRDDSAVNLSKDDFNEFVRPYDEKIFKELGGGSIHFCGRADQWIFDMIQMEGCKGININWMPNKVFGVEFAQFLQPEFAKRKMPLNTYQLQPYQFDEFMDAKVFDTGISLFAFAGSKDQAQSFVERAKSDSVCL